MTKSTQNNTKPSKPAITTEEVKHVAQLGNLPLTDEQITTFQKQLSEVLNYIEELQEIDTAGVEPTSQVTGLHNVYREDCPQDNLNQKQALSNAKQTKNGYIQVPGVLKE